MIMPRDQGNETDKILIIAAALVWKFRAPRPAPLGSIMFYPLSRFDGKMIEKVDHRLAEDDPPFGAVDRLERFAYLRKGDGPHSAVPRPRR